MRYRLAAVCFGLAALGITTEIVHRQTHTPQLTADDGETVLLDGCVTNPPVFSPGREQFTLDLSSRAAVRMTVNLRPDDQALSLKYGQRVELPARIRAPRNFQNPDSTLGDSTFGQISAMQPMPTSPYGVFLGFDSSVRVVQVSGKIIF